jgi:uncharacterized protein YciI
MKRFLPGLLACALTASIAAQAPPPGLAAYYVAFLKRAPGWTAASGPEAETLQAAHIASLERRWTEGVLVGAGPADGSDTVRGVLILKVDSPEKAKTVADDDPAVKAGRLETEVHPWWGPPGIGEMYAASTKDNSTTKPKMRTYQLVLLTKGPKFIDRMTPEREKMQRGHLQHIADMAGSGKIVAAGPFLDDGELRGVFVFNCDAAEAKRLVEEDPSVVAGHHAAEYLSWVVADGTFADKMVMPDVLK